MHAHATGLDDFQERQALCVGDLCLYVLFSPHAYAAPATHLDLADDAQALAAREEHAHHQVPVPARPAACDVTNAPGGGEEGYSTS